MKKISLGNSVFPVVLLVSTLLYMGSPLAMASSHREAPLTASDPLIDATDLYAFVSPDKPNTVTLIANYIPFQEPNGGPNFNRFASDAMYEININNNGNAKAQISYQFTFQDHRRNDNTFLFNTGPIGSIGDPNQNVYQTYTVTKVDHGVKTVLGTNLPVPPPNIGPKSTPNYAALADGAISTLSDGSKVFAGAVDDPFFVDLSVFDLLTIRKLPGNMGGGIDTLKGYNVSTLALQVPISEVTANYSTPTDPKDPNAVIGVWTNSYRRSTTVLRSGGKVAFKKATGNWVQVSQLGSPLVNEVVIPLGQKDLFNAVPPKDQAKYFANDVTDPELGKLFKGLYNIAVPPQGAFGTADARDDLVSIFLTGIPGLNQPAKVNPAEMLRLNLAIAPTAQPNRMGVLGGDNQGYPNGRRLADDVVDISLQAVAGAAYPLFHPGFKIDPLATKLGDGVDANDVPFRSTFPYEALAHPGVDNVVPHQAQAAQ